jgi:hypothetical protein
VPRPTLTERLEGLMERVQTLEAALNRQQAIAESAVKYLEKQLVDRARAEEQLHNKFAELTAKNAALDEKCRTLEKHSDRTWQVWLALLVAGVGLLVSLLKK